MQTRGRRFSAPVAEKLRLPRTLQISPRKRVSRARRIAASDAVLTHVGPCHLGVDPGGKGAWALLDGRGGLVDAEHFPLSSDGIVDAARLLARWRDLGIVAATIERVGQITRVKGRAMGISGRFKFGMNAGVPRSVLEILGVPVTYVDPAAWKRATGVTSNKKTSLRAAQQLWPEHADSLFVLVKDVDRAEAALLARFGQRTGRTTIRRTA